MSKKNDVTVDVFCPNHDAVDEVVPLTVPLTEIPKAVPADESLVVPVNMHELARSVTSKPQVSLLKRLKAAIPKLMPQRVRRPQESFD